jgi:beta-phosphoglucomutase-like phosphatase (HAD superfamily)
MKKLIIFDLDGVLVNTKELHFNALNAALSTIDKKYCITMQEHLTIFDGLKTREKLNMLSSLKGLPHDLHEQIWVDKQKTTKLLTENIPQNKIYLKIVNLLKFLNN